LSVPPRSVLRATSGGALVKVLSVLSWLGFGDRHEVFKAAAWSATNSTRVKPRTLRHRSRPNV
jgi:hypothetical protein